MPKKVIVYLEGPSDKAVMERIFKEVVGEAEQKGIRIEFKFLKNKSQLMIRGPEKALNILRNNPAYHVALMPDLYPRNMGGDHETVEELRRLLKEGFDKEIKSKKIEDAGSLLSRFHIHCFKYDLEVLLLAAREELKEYLNVKKLNARLKRKVEDQDHQNPPKKIVERLFAGKGKKYDPKIDAPAILEKAGLEKLTTRCPQCFAPFVDFISSFALTS